MSMLRYCIPNGGDILLNLTHTMGIFAEWKAAESGNNFLYHLFWFLYYNDQFKMHNKFKQTKSKRTGQSPQPQPDGEGDPRGYKCTCWITKIFEHLLEGRKRWTNLISREAWQLVSNAYKYKAESLAFLRKEIQATKNALDKAQTTARSFSTRERCQLCKGLSTAIEAEAARNKEVLSGGNPPQRENGYQYHPHPYTWSGRRGSSRRGRGRGYDTHRYWWDPPPKTFFKTPPSTAGVIFQSRMDL